MTDKIIEYAEYVDGGFDCNVWFCEVYMDIAGERTNGMELKAERDSYFNQVDQMAQQYLNQIKGKFDQFGSQYDSLNTLYQVQHQQPSVQTNASHHHHKKHHKHSSFLE
jgi:hypothetical protein